VNHNSIAPATVCVAGNCNTLCDNMRVTLLELYIVYMFDIVNFIMLHHKLLSLYQLCIQ